MISTMMEMTTWHGETCRVICQNGQEKFAEQLVDGEASTVGEAQAGSSHEPPHPEPPPKVVLRKHSIYNHLPKDRNCEVCRRTEITRAPCRKPFRTQIHRAGNFGDMMTADHKVLFDECESRNGHRYALVVKDLAKGYRRIHVKQRLLKKRK